MASDNIMLLFNNIKKNILNEKEIIDKWIDDDFGFDINWLSNELNYTMEVLYVNFPFLEKYFNFVLNWTSSKELFNSLLKIDTDYIQLILHTYNYIDGTKSMFIKKDNWAKYLLKNREIEKILHKIKIKDDLSNIYL